MCQVSLQRCQTTLVFVCLISAHTHEYLKDGETVNYCMTLLADCLLFFLLQSWLS